MDTRQLVISLACWWPAGAVTAVEPPDLDPAQPDGATVEMVTLDYTDELALEALVDYVGQTLDVRVLYGDELRNQKVTLRPGSIELPKSRLLDLLRSVLRVRGLALVPGDLPRYYRIVPIEAVPRLAGEIREHQTGVDRAPAYAADRIVTEVIHLPSGDTKAVAPHVKAFMSSAKASVIEIPEKGILIVSDYEPVIARIRRLIELIDAPPDPITTEIITLQHGNPVVVGGQVTRLLAERVKAGEGDLTAISISPGVLAGKLVVTGPKGRLAEVLELVDLFDQPPDVEATMRTYTPLHTSAGRIKSLVEGVIIKGPTLGAAQVSLFVDDAANRLYVTAPTEVHTAIDALLVREDRAWLASSRPLRIYRPRNRDAGEIVDTLIKLLEEATVTLVAGPGGSPLSPLPAIGTLTDHQETSAGPRPLAPPEPPAPSTGPSESEPESSARRIQGPDWILTEDQHTNSILAIGSREFHARLAELIEELDRRRPQVMIEMMLVAVSVSDSLNLGIELKSRDGDGSVRGLLFSDFGLSSFDGATGAVALSPGIGLNGALLRVDEYAVVLQALASQGNSRVLATPRILVADGTEGTLRSVDEAPFTSVNASDTVATTSFGGFESAGTTLTVTPHVAQGDHLALEYNLSFSSFTGSSSGTTTPPPRTTNSFAGEVEVPDGYTVVVGGLTVENDSDSVGEVPLLGRIPILGLLFQNSTAARTRTRVYAFIRPVILRDDKFADLKFITQADLQQAEIASKDFPSNRTMWMQ